MAHHNVTKSCSKIISRNNRLTQNKNNHIVSVSIHVMHHVGIASFCNTNKYTQTPTHGATFAFHRIVGLGANSCTIHSCSYFVSMLFFFSDRFVACVVPKTLRLGCKIHIYKYYVVSRQFHTSFILVHACFIDVLFVQNTWLLIVNINDFCVFVGMLMLHLKRDASWIESYHFKFVSVWAQFHAWFFCAHASPINLFFNCIDVWVSIWCHC